MPMYNLPPMPSVTIILLVLGGIILAIMIPGYIIERRKELKKEGKRRRAF